MPAKSRAITETIDPNKAMNQVSVRKSLAEYPSWFGSIPCVLGYLQEKRRNAVCGNDFVSIRAGKSYRFC